MDDAPKVENQGRFIPVTDDKPKAVRVKPRPSGDLITQTIFDVQQSPRLRAGIRALEPRVGEFATEEQMQLAGLAMVPEARAMLEERLETMWATPPAFPSEVPELIIGSGYHCAVFAAARVLRGFPRPYVLERGDPGKVGGLWAMSKAPSFYLNSRQDTLASVGLPDDGTPTLNLLPGAPLQAHHVSGQDFIDNALMRLIVRLTLARYAVVLPGAEVAAVKPNSVRSLVELASGSAIACRRIVDARGAGDPTGQCDGNRVLSFTDFMGRMDNVFPMRGMGRLAIVGDGNSALCAAEAALGIGPSRGMSTSALDFLPSIDMFSPALPDNRKEWRKLVRGRYQKVGSYQRRRPGDPPARRLHVRRARGFVLPAGDTVLVNEFTYDHVVMCTGWSLPELAGLSDSLWTSEAPGQTILGSRWGTRNIYRIGPAAKIPLSFAEQTEQYASKPGTDVSMFRMGTRTRALAASLPAA